MENVYFIREDHKDYFTVVIHAYELAPQKLKKKYHPQKIKKLNISEICDVFETYIPKLVKIRRGRFFSEKIIKGLEKIIYIRFEFLNNELKGILDRFKTRHAPIRERRVSKGKDKIKGHRIKIKEEDDDDSSIMFISQDSELMLIDIKKDFKIDEDAKDKNLIKEMEDLNVDEEISTASYFGPASKEEIRFTWDKPVEGLDLSKTKIQDKGKYGLFSRAERQVLEEIKTPSTTPSKSNRNDDGTSNSDGVLLDTVINDEGNFANFPQHMGEALSEVQTTPKRKTVDGRGTLETPSKRNRIDDGTSNGAAALPDIVINDEVNFTNFPQHMGEALSEVQTTPKRKPASDKDIVETPSKRIRKSLNEQWGELKTESLDDCWVLADLEETDNIVKKSNKKKKKKKVFDECKTICLNVENIHKATVPIDEAIINPRSILIPAEKLFQMPSSIFAGSKTSRPMNRKLLGRFQEVITHPPPLIVQDNSRNNSDLQALPPVIENASQLRIPSSNIDPILSPVKAEPGEDFLPIEKTRHDAKETVESPTLDFQVETDAFPIENPRSGDHITNRPFNKTHPVDSLLPPTDSLGQYQDTIPLEEIGGDSIDVCGAGDPQDPDGPGDPNDPPGSPDNEWDCEYVYQRIKQLCEGGVTITFKDLASVSETKKINRILAFEHILKLGTDEKICLEQSLETEIITIWLPEKEGIFV